MIYVGLIPTKRNLTRVLQSSLRGEDGKSIVLDYEFSHLLRIPEWKSIQKAKNRSLDEKNVCPVEKLVSSRKLLINNLFIPIKKTEEYVKRLKRQRRKA